MGKKKKKTLTPKRARLLKAILNGKTITEAEKIAGYATKNPGQNGSQALAEIRRNMPEVLEACDLSDVTLIEKYLKPLMNAMETKLGYYEGKVASRTNMIAWGPRREGLDMAFKLKGSYAASLAENAPSRMINVIILDVPRPDRSAILNQKPVIPHIAAPNGGNGNK